MMYNTVLALAGCWIAGAVTYWAIWYLFTGADSRRQKAKPCTVSIDRSLVTSSDFRKAWAGVDAPGSSPRTIAEMETLSFRERAWPSSKREYETPMYRPDLGVVPGGRIVELPTFAERIALANARKTPRDVNDVVAHMSARQTTLWDIIPAPADLNKPAVG